MGEVWFMNDHNMIGEVYQNDVLKSGHTFVRNDLYINGQVASFCEDDDLLQQCEMWKQMYER